MQNTPKPYCRLPGTGFRRELPGWAIVLLFFIIGIFALLFRGRRVQLWLGDEHLLLVEWDGYREYYKRFDYRDIQAFIVRKTFEGKIINGILIVISTFFWGIALISPEVRVAFLILAGIMGLLLLANILSGPTCECRVCTAVQTELLPSLGRLSRARKVLDRIRPFIVAAQGQLSSEEIPARMQEWLSGSWSAAAPPAGSLNYVVDDPNAPPRIL
jgi:hypothetical protein